MPTCRHSKRRRTLPGQTILAWRCAEWRSLLLGSGDFLTASFFTRGRRTRWVASWSRARALALGHRLGAEVAKVLHELRRPWLAEGEAESGTAQGSPLRR